MMKGIRRYFANLVDPEPSAAHGQDTSVTAEADRLLEEQTRREYIDRDITNDMWPRE